MLLLCRIPENHVEALAQLLKDWRASVCDNFNVMPYHILPTSGIAAIANAAPVTNAELSGIDGVGRIRVKKYGDAIIEIVKSYLSKVPLSFDVGMSVFKRVLLANFTILCSTT